MHGTPRNVPSVCATRDQSTSQRFDHSPRTCTHAHTLEPSVALVPHFGATTAAVAPKKTMSSSRLSMLSASTAESVGRGKGECIPDPRQAQSLLGTAPTGDCTYSRDVDAEILGMLGPEA